MGTLWTFGASFTSGDGCVETLGIRDGDIKYYNEYKKSDNDIWPNILGKMIGFNVKNIGKSGASNDYILDSIIDNFDMIQSNDVVIIQKTAYQRFDIPNLNTNKFHTQYGEQLYMLSIDLNTLIANAYDLEGKVAVTEKYHITKDDTHTVEAGAILNASIVAKSIAKMKNCGLSKFIVKK
jgi:hypothetical protein